MADPLREFFPTLAPQVGPPRAGGPASRPDFVDMARTSASPASPRLKEAQATADRVRDWTRGVDTMAASQAARVMSGVTGALKAPMSVVSPKTGARFADWSAEWRNISNAGTDGDFGAMWEAVGDKSDPDLTVRSPIGRAMSTTLNSGFPEQKAASKATPIGPNGPRQAGPTQAAAKAANTPTKAQLRNQALLDEMSTMSGAQVDRFVASLGAPPKPVSPQDRALTQLLDAGDALEQRWATTKDPEEKAALEARILELLGLVGEVDSLGLDKFIQRDE